jgi:hypothetical protein
MHFERSGPINNIIDPAESDVPGDLLDIEAVGSELSDSELPPALATEGLGPVNAISAPGAPKRSRRSLPHRAAKETVPPAARWLGRWFPGASPVARQLAVMPAAARDGPGGCVHVLCHRALPGGAVDLAIY